MRQEVRLIYRESTKKNKPKGTYRAYIAGKGENPERIMALGLITKKQAEVFLAEYRAGLLTKPCDNLITVNQLIEQFTPLYAESQASLNTVHLFRTLTSGRISELLGRMNIQDIKTKHIESFKNILSKDDISNRTINMHLNEINKLINYAIDEEYIDYSPRVRYMNTEAPKNVTRKISEDSFDKLIKCILYNKDSELYLYVNLMRYTALRTFEAINLLWSDIDFNKKTINIRSNNKKKPGRKVPLVSDLKNILSKFNVNIKRDRVVRYDDNDQVRYILKGYEKKIGFRITPRMFRKTVLNKLAENGVSPVFLQAYAGHADFNTTQLNYIDIETNVLGEKIEGKL